MYKKIIILAGLIFPTMAIADRPAMSERVDEPEQAQPMAIEQPEQIEVTAEEAVVEEVVVKQVSGDVLEMQPGEPSSSTHSIFRGVACRWTRFKMNLANLLISHRPLANLQSPAGHIQTALYFLNTPELFTW